MEECDWQTPDLAEFTARVRGRLGNDVSPKLIERIACIVHYEDLYDAIASGGQWRDRALTELYDIRWYEDVDGAPQVQYRGYLFRSAYVLLRKRLLSRGQMSDHDQLTELAVQAATEARLSVERNFHQVKARESFWGWLVQVLAHAVSHVLDRLNRQPVEDEVPDDERGEASVEMTQDDAELVIAVRDELKRKARLKRLSSDQFDILYWSYWERASNIEIAERLSAVSTETITANHVGHVKHAALTVLRNNLRESGFMI